MKVFLDTNVILESFIEREDVRTQKKCKILADIELNAYFCNRKVKIGETSYGKYRIYNNRECIA